MNIKTMHTNLTFCEKSRQSMYHLVDGRLVLDNFLSAKSKCHIHIFIYQGAIWLCLHHFIDQNLTSLLQVVFLLPLRKITQEIYLPFPWLLDVFVGRVATWRVPSAFTTIDSDIKSTALAHFGSIVTHLELETVLPSFPARG